MKPIVSVADPIPEIVDALRLAGHDIEPGGVRVPVEGLDPNRAELRIRTQMGYASTDENLLSHTVTHQVVIMAVGTSPDVCINKLEEVFQVLFTAQWGMARVSQMVLVSPATPVLTESESVIAYEITLRVST